MTDRLVPVRSGDVRADHRVRDAIRSEPERCGFGPRGDYVEGDVVVTLARRVILVGKA